MSVSQAITGPLIGLIIILVGIPIVIFLYFVWLFTRFVEAHEKIADALERAHPPRENSES